MLNKLKSLKIFQSDTSLMQLIRTYIVGAINLLLGLTLTYLFQFFVLTFIEFPLRTYVPSLILDFFFQFLFFDLQFRFFQF